MIRLYPKTAQAPTAISIAPLFPAFLPTQGMEGMSRYGRGMERVWERYEPTRKSLRIKYSGMPYRGEGAGSKKNTAPAFLLPIPYWLLPAPCTPSPYAARKRTCETARIPAPRTSTEPTRYADPAESAQKHRNCETGGRSGTPLTFQRPAEYLLSQFLQARHFDLFCVFLLFRILPTCALISPLPRCKQKPLRNC